jgi:hypothetical protein
VGRRSGWRAPGPSGRKARLPILGYHIKHRLSSLFFCISMSDEQSKTPRCHENGCAEGTLECGGLTLPSARLLPPEPGRVPSPTACRIGRGYPKAASSRRTPSRFAQGPARFCLSNFHSM